MQDIGVVKSILVATKYRFIGDTLLAIPLLRAIATRWPDAQVSLLTGARASELMLNCPYVHEVIEFDPYRKADKGVGRYLGLIGELRQRSFDLAFICNRSFHAALTAYLAGAQTRVGWSGFDKRDFLLTATCSYDPDASELESYLDLFRAVAPDVKPSSKLELWVDLAEREGVRDLMPRHIGGGPIVGIQAGATHAEKRWPAEKFASLMAQMLDSFPDARFILIGGPDECIYSDQLLPLLRSDVAERCVSLVGKLPLRQTLAALTFLDLYIAGDTAIRHAAVALDVPSVALFGPTSIRKWGNQCPPRHIALQASDGDVASISESSVLHAAAGAASLRDSVAMPLAGRLTESREEVQV